MGFGREVVDGADDLDTERAGAAVELFDPHEGAHRLPLPQDAFGDAFGQCFQKVEPFLGQRRRDRLGHAVIGQDAVHVIVERIGHRAHLDHDVEADALRGAAFRLKGPDLDRDDMIAHRDPVQRAVG